MSCCLVQEVKQVVYHVDDWCRYLVYLQPSVHKRYNRYLFFTTLIFVALCSTELVPPGIRHHIIGPYALKAWPCTIVCFTICYEMIFFRFQRQGLKGNIFSNILIGVFFIFRSCQQSQTNKRELI